VTCLLITLSMETCLLEDMNMYIYIHTYITCYVDMLSETIMPYHILSCVCCFVLFDRYWGIVMVLWVSCERAKEARTHDLEL